MFLRVFLVAWVILLSGLAGPAVLHISPFLLPLYWIGCCIGGYAAGKQVIY